MWLIIFNIAFSHGHYVDHAQAVSMIVPASVCQSLRAGLIADPDWKGWYPAPCRLSGLMDEAEAVGISMHYVEQMQEWPDVYTTCEFVGRKVVGGETIVDTNLCVAPVKY